MYVLEIACFVRKSFVLYYKSKQNRVVITGDMSRTKFRSIGGNYCFNELKLDKESGAFFHGDKHLKDTQEKRGFM